jgi:hypothetical protein
MHPMDPLAWAAVFGGPVCFATGALILNLLSRIQWKAVRAAFAAPTILILFVAPTLSMVRIVARFEDYDLCVASRAARMGESETCPKWTVDAFEAAGGHADI